MKVKYLHYLVLVVLVIFTGASAINNYNAGVYADAHQLDGASVGWFAPNGMLILLLAVIVTISYSIYLFTRTKSNQ